MKVKSGMMYMYRKGENNPGRRDLPTSIKEKGHLKPWRRVPIHQDFDFQLLKFVELSTVL